MLANLLAYSPRRWWRVSINLSCVRGRMAAMGMEGLEKWVVIACVYLCSISDLLLLVLYLNWLAGG